jgi:predicted ribosome quality control (RQC) complex YloA/Tae2 family protein
MVPVIYTLKKHVRKAKGAAGSVIVEREKVIMVKPRKE